MDQALWISILAAAITAGTPILYAALGEVLAQRSGVMNLGVEGMMLIGAVTGFTFTVKMGSPWVGLLAAMGAAGVLALVHAFLTISLRANQVVSGLALTIFGTGLSGYLGKSMIGIPAPATFKQWLFPGLGKLPVLGPILFNQDSLVYITYILVPLLWFFVYRTKPGLHLRSTGENPAAADAVGVNIFATRYVYVVVGGMLSGVAGAYLSLAYAPSWLENMTAGRGWIAIALVIFAMWDPLRAMAGAYIFGGVDALTFRLQALGVVIPSFFLKMLPYLFTIIVLVIATRETVSRKSASPEALGLAYDREGR
ncbi:MAG TPA: ABC transporter permease [Bacillota bacterium]|jgi:simple sugar transport system permease protein